jgi:hypothetical protein
MTHLQKMHPHVSKEADPDPSAHSAQSTDSTQVSQPKLTTFKAFAPKKSTSQPLTSQRINELDAAVQRFIVKRLKPLSLVDDPAFQQLLSALEPKYSPVCAKTLTTRIQELHAELRSSLHAQVSKTASVGFTHDSWTSRANQSYDTMTTFH